MSFLIMLLSLGYFLSTAQVSAQASANPIYSLSISDSGTLNKTDGYARVILTDAQGKEYLVYEASGPFDSGSFSFENYCEETCVLSGITPKSIDTEISGAILTISRVSVLNDEQGLGQQVRAMGIKSYGSAVHKTQRNVKIDKINQYIKENNPGWTAGETSVSGYSYEEKKMLMGVSGTEKLPNLQGFEYYKGGIFEMAGAQTSPKSASTSALPSSFD